LKHDGQGSNLALDPRRWKALFLLSLAQFLVILDTSIIGVALPTIQQQFGFSQAELQWIFSAYVIVFGALLLLGGRLSDILGQRKIFAIGFAILTGASVLAGLAPTGDILIAARALQGIGAAFIAPAAMSMVLNLFTVPRERSKAMGIWGAAAPAGGTAGVFLGGVITAYVDWSWVFLINVPIGIMVLGLARPLLPRGSKQKGRVDYPGAVSITAALITLVYAIVDTYHFIATCIRGIVCRICSNTEAVKVAIDSASNIQSPQPSGEQHSDGLTWSGMDTNVVLLEPLLAADTGIRGI
jgi:MFS family permease